MQRQGTLLDDLSGFEFEDLAEDIFRNLGYENVRQAPTRTGDEGRDILMEERVNGARRAVVVQCKHTDVVSRPTLQKTHSAVATYDYDGPKRGLIITTGRFTNPAKEHAEELKGTDYPVELMDGEDLRELADEIGLDLYNGRIEILCSETLRPYDPASSITGHVDEELAKIDNVNIDAFDVTTNCHLVATLMVEAHISAIFETTVGVIYRVNKHDSMSIRCDAPSPMKLKSRVSQLVETGPTMELDLKKFGQKFDNVEMSHFNGTETSYKDWVTNQWCREYSKSVSYTGDNNVTYTKVCEPTSSDVNVKKLHPVYLPKVGIELKFGDYSYRYIEFRAGPSSNMVRNDIDHCVHCERSRGSLTFCGNCGSINCFLHTRSERLTGKPICSKCGVTKRFALRKRHFFDSNNLHAFEKKWDDLTKIEKLLENKPLLGSLAIIGILLLLMLFI